MRRDVSIFGHPDCNSWASLLIARPSGKIFPLLPDEPKFDKLLGEVLRKIGGLSLVNDDAGTPPFACRRLLRTLLAGALIIGVTDFARSAAGDFALFAAWPGAPVGVGMHNFMDAAQVANAPNDAVVRAPTPAFSRAR